MRSRRQTFLMRLQHNLQIFSPRNLLVATICTFCLTCSLCVWGVLTRLALWINRFCIPTFSAIFVRDVAPCAKNAHRSHLPVRFPVFSECHPRDKNIRLEPESIVFLLRPATEATNANARAILFFFVRPNGFAWKNIVWFSPTVKTWHDMFSALCCCKGRSTCVAVLGGTRKNRRVPTWKGIQAYRNCLPATRESGRIAKLGGVRAAGESPGASGASDVIHPVT